MVSISCITLLPINLTNSDANRIDTKTTRIIIKSTEKKNIPDSNVYGGVRASLQGSNGKSGIQLLPVPDANSPIILIPLT